MILLYANLSPIQSLSTEIEHVARQTTIELINAQPYALNMPSTPSSPSHDFQYSVLFVDLSLAG